MYRVNVTDFLLFKILYVESFRYSAPRFLWAGSCKSSLLWVPKVGFEPQACKLRLFALGIPSMHLWPNPLLPILHISRGSHKSSSSSSSSPLKPCTDHWCPPTLRFSCLLSYVLQQKETSLPPDRIVLLTSYDINEWKSAYCNVPVLCITHEMFKPALYVYL